MRHAAQNHAAHDEARGRDGAEATGGGADASLDALGTEFDTISFMEPHKKFQSSFSLFQRRPVGWGEPIHTMYP